MLKGFRVRCWQSGATFFRYRPDPLSSSLFLPFFSDLSPSSLSVFAHPLWFVFTSFVLLPSFHSVLCPPFLVSSFPQQIHSLDNTTVDCAIPTDVRDLYGLEAAVEGAEGGRGGLSATVDDATYEKVNNIVKLGRGAPLFRLGVQVSQ